MPPASPHRFLELAIFRFEDVCIDIQDDMDGYLRTAALKKKAGIEATFRWLQRRQISVCVLTDYGREDFFLLMGRLDWTLGEDQLIQMAVLDQSRKPNPVRLAIDAAGLANARQALVVVDTPRLLHCATTAGAHLIFGVTNGRSTYRQLAAEPFQSLLDSTLQLPDYLLSNLPEGLFRPQRINESFSGPPRLLYPS